MLVGQQTAHPLYLQAPPQSRVEDRSVPNTQGAGARSLFADLKHYAEKSIGTLASAMSANREKKPIYDTWLGIRRPNSASANTLYVDGRGVNHPSPASTIMQLFTKIHGGK